MSIIDLTKISFCPRVFSEPFQPVHLPLYKPPRREVMAKPKLEKLATRLLRKAGFSSTGRKLGEQNPRQWAFERRLVSIPMGGKPNSG